MASSSHPLSNSHQLSNSHHQAEAKAKVTAPIVEHQALLVDTPFTEAPLSRSMHQTPTTFAAQRPSSTLHSPPKRFRLSNMQLKHKKRHSQSKSSIHKPEDKRISTSESSAGFGMLPNLKGDDNIKKDQSHIDSIVSQYSQVQGILAPVQDKLRTLKATTPRNLPAYNPRIRARRHAEILKSRLLPVGDFIMQFLAQLPVDQRGAVELKLCRHIATKYWPLPVTKRSSLQIQAIYRNAIFKRSLRSKSTS